jgi:hypothetical protein
LEENTYWKLLDILKCTPNLRSLKLKLPSGVFSPEETVNLRLLKRLKMNLREDGVKFFKFLVEKCGIRLEKVKLSIPLLTTEQAAKKLASLLPNIPVIFLKIFYRAEAGPAILNIITEANLKFWKLKINFEEPQFRLVESFFAPIEAIMINSSETLRSLELVCNLDEGDSTASLQFPILPVLKSLNIRFNFDSVDETNNFTRSLLSRVTTNHFQVLKRVRIHMADRSDVFQTSTTLFNANQCQFDTVEELEVNSWRIADKWGTLFPNLKRLKATLNEKRLCYVLENMTKLEHMTLTFVKHRDGNVNSLLSGVPGADEVYQEPAERISQHRAIYCRPSLLSFTGKVDR